jgi:glycosyltransferase involved in cell wall biosynthesis
MISVVAAVMNRTDRVQRCLASWCGHEKVEEFVLVDWCSNPPVSIDPGVSEALLDNPKARLVEITGREYFNLPGAYNAAIKEAKGPKILKVDIDYVLEDPALVGHLDGLDLSGRFYTGQRWHFVFWGLFLFDKSMFIESGGYNESLEGWGNDDVDIYERMGKIGAKHMLDKSLKWSVHHIPHGDELRTANYREKNKKISAAQNIKKIRGFDNPEQK